MKTSILTDRNALLAIAVFGILQAFYNIMLPLHPDEAYYWLWSVYPELSYYDHPPMVAWIIWPFTLFGDSEFTVRLAAVFCMSGASVYMYLLTRDVFSRETAWLALLVSATLPSTNMGYTIITPDAPLILFWAASAYHSYKAVFRGSWTDYMLTGVMLGGLMLSKYTSVLYMGSLFIFVLLKRPKLFISVKPWAAVVVAFIVFSPVIIWNMQNEWLSFSFQYAHGTGNTFRSKYLVEFIAGLFVVFTPVYFAILLRYFFDVKDWFKNDRYFFVMVSCLFPLLFFLYKGMFKRMELNWAAIAFITGTAVFAHAVQRYKLKKTFIAGAVLAFTMTFVVKFSNLLPLPPNLNIHSRIQGYEQAVERYESYIKPGDELFGGHLRIASMIAFYVEGRTDVSIPIRERFSQFDIWDKEKDFSKMEGLFLSEGDEYKKLKEVFSSVELVERYVFRQEGLKEREFYIYRVKG